MPIYEYECVECGIVEEYIVLSGDGKIIPMHCDKDMRKILSCARVKCPPPWTECNKPDGWED